MDHTRDLLDRFPQLSTDVYQAVLEANKFDAELTFKVMCDMVVDAGMMPKKDYVEVVKSGVVDVVDVEDKDIESGEEKRDVIVRSGGSGSESWSGSGSEGDDVGKTVEDGECVEECKVVKSVFESGVSDFNRNSRNGWKKNGRGLSFAGTVKAKVLTSRYPWADRAAVQEILEGCGEVIEDAEAVLLGMFPVDDVQGFHGGQDELIQSKRRNDVKDSGKIAEVLRIADEKHLQEAANGFDETKLRRDIALLKREIAKQASYRDNCYWMASHTRKSEHGAQGRYHQSIVDKNSAKLVEMVMLLPDYKGNCIDLHGFSVHQALALLSAKLDQVVSLRTYPKLRIITGRGKHSVNMKSTLRPAVEKLLRDRKLKFSGDNDGGAFSVSIK
eukprot:Plantae.Rhodophyta-Hildenbrandia_rubra.ctg14614.p1 GENE.Plantae.Rhodophyta-Hildenbrandia_rubra.ctg14614~~Plantae.Rhodophyta-Hildenbrandia_rubra.ctg14614.p1  ORF type:complete len:386 (+),score=94.58 Plantae.Rhodophyta-Hildenbrandia_rubra.ctg14614:1136-2293(+)